MASLSLCMIVKNEENTLARCLNSIRQVIDEIIIVDTGSHDKTKEIAQEFNAKVYDYKWIDDFSAARNFSFSLANMDYIMWLDADDIVKPEDLQKLINIKKNLNDEVKQIAALYNVGFDENKNVTMAYYRERIFKNDGAFIWNGAVHECIPFIPSVIYADFAITHSKLKPTTGERNLNIYRKIKKNRRLIPRELYYYARELFYNNYIEEAKESFLSFIKTDGWYINKINSCLLLSKCWQLENNYEEAKKALLNSFIYCEPTAEICCELGRLFMENHEYKLAIYWYTLALNGVPNIKSGAFVNIDDYTYIPAIQLCVCYDRIGNLESSKQFNNLASKFKPYSKAVELNKQYFANIK